MPNFQYKTLKVIFFYFGTCKTHRIGVHHQSKSILGNNIC